MLALEKNKNNGKVIRFDISNGNIIKFAKKLRKSKS